jgi:anthranilate phosphoribosyltransferase
VTLNALLTNSPAPPSIFLTNPPATLDEPSYEAIRDFVLINASAVLVVAGKAKSFVEGVALARKSMDEGGATEALEGFRRTAADAIKAVEA